MCVSDLFTSFLAFYFIVRHDGVTDSWRRDQSQIGKVINENVI